QLTLDQHIGVRIPGGQPIYYQALTSPDFPKKRAVVTVSGNFRFAHTAERRCMPRNNAAAGTAWLLRFVLQVERRSGV
ncbi:MAG: hypothetical protein ACLP3R_22980, partial [Candidatus Korobacteraceae bacterium]